MSDQTLGVVVYGIINAGKSSLINALAGRTERPAGPIGGTTVDVAGVEWRMVGELVPLPSESLPPFTLPPCGGGPGWGDVAGLSGLESANIGDRGQGDASPPHPPPQGGREREKRWKPITPTSPSS